MLCYLNESFGGLRKWPTIIINGNTSWSFQTHLISSVHSNDCCLIGCQIVQLVHMQGYESASQVLTTVTTLLRSPSKTWIQPSQLEFDLNQPILPTVDSLRLSVEHYIKFTFAFCNAAGESDLNLSLEFPMNFIGYTELVGDSSMIQVQQRSNSIASSLSLSSLNSEEVASQDSAIDTLISPCSKPDCYPQLITLYK
ncbi:uncharacterized protein B0P05DRAFT_636568 [Gilbertella persicaria]|uniref:uncharacterized protein n=1 Tax=Gilbertella persicaria TaxID=101096 RepID=UPI00221F2BB2|nr:uncharacterized protein B0P05DRAFT_636568 [Gilbertella persicaria]KAI8082524.1 hypothetical protein B0P05DRAFT_636568 [Gilbertella persicaria]